jgi:catechol-2,3-dioxygenase
VIGIKWIAMMKVEGIDHVALAVRDVEASVVWYRDVLGLGRMHEDAWGNHPAVMGTGNTSVALFPQGSSGSQDQPARGFRHLAFRVAATDFQAARVAVEAAVVRCQYADHGVAESIYFLDPDGNQIEVTAYRDAG